MPKQATMPKQNIDIVGLREQIKANATITFPKTVEKYRLYCTRNHQPFTELDAFEIVVRTVSILQDSEDDEQYQAILIVKADKEIAAVSKAHDDLDHALESLLAVLADEMAQLLEDANGYNEIPLTKLGAWRDSNMDSRDVSL